MDGSRANDEHAIRAYLIGAVLVWLAMIAGTTALLGGTASLSPMLLILSAGALWFVLLVPTLLHRR
ncbi:MAG TPA: hypothetical protein VFN57_14155 [Thermomicrobiaceae bacterium]|nr:hypothetical protein [Thermomicrobiaceae bacterium]